MTGEEGREGRGARPRAALHIAPAQTMHLFMMLYSVMCAQPRPYTAKKNRARGGSPLCPGWRNEIPFLYCKMLETLIFIWQRTIGFAAGSLKKGHHNKYWFRKVRYRLNGAASKTEGNGGKPDGAAGVNHLPFSEIVDNTEGVGAFFDLEIPNGTDRIADFGGGVSDAPEKFIKNKHPSVEFFVLDPFNRTVEHNWAAQQNIMATGGVDIATAMSVLNVIPTLIERLRLIAIMHESLRRGGIAYFKVWAGSWPVRGMGRASVDTVRNVYQANKWASAFQHEVAAVFGKKNVFVDNNKNLIVALKA